jgi:hypothetical protein
MTNTIHKLIANDLNSKMDAHSISKYYFHTKLGICSEPTLTRILNGKGGKSIPFQIVCELYKAMGEKEINISSEGVRLLVKIGY